MSKFILKTLVASFIIAMCAPLSASADVTIDETNFPDENFRNWLLEQDYGQDGVITTKEIAEITEIDVKYMNIYTLKGIEYFAALKKLNCALNYMTVLDVSKNTELEDLQCTLCEITALNISGCKALATLSCGNNKITTLDMSKNTALTTLSCGSNKLTTIDVSKNLALSELRCNYNQLRTLDVAKNTALTTLDCGNNQLRTLNVANNKALKTLDCDNNQLMTLDVSNCTALHSLECNNNQLTTLNNFGCKDLAWLYCQNNYLHGENLDAIISNLPNERKGIYIWILNGKSYDVYGGIFIYDSGSKIEGNICTKSQVAAIKDRHWGAFYKSKYNWEEYEGCDDAEGIKDIGFGSEIDANAPAYDLNGNRVEGWQSKKGIYIINGEKVVVK